MNRPRFLFCLFDALRRDMIRPELMPNLHGFRAGWCDFPNSSSAFPSETRVQVSSFVTGCHPGGSRPDSARQGHGVMANSFYDPALGFPRALDTSDLERMAEAQRFYGRVHKARTIGECLGRAGRRYGVVTTGTPGNGRLLNLHAAELGQPVFSTRSQAVSSPAARHESVVARFGAPPAPTFPNTAITAYAVRVLLEHFIPEHDPDLQVIWFNEPDLSYHYRGIGSPESLVTLRAVDTAFGQILDWWESEGRAAGWTIIAASDHGQVSVTQQIDVAGAMRDAGFRVGPGLGPDIDVAIKRGYSGHLVVRDRAPALVARVIDFLAEQSWSGALLTRTGAQGTLPMAALGLLNERSPDIYYALRTSDAPNEWGYPGSCRADNPDIPLGGGVHGGLHRVETNTVLVLGGDGITPSAVHDCPASVIDIAPTILHGLGVPVPDSAMGRVLREAFEPGAPSPCWREEILRAERGGYRQEMVIAHVEGVDAPYLRGGKRLA